jgi:hypothetical protein
VSRKRGVEKSVTAAGMEVKRSPEGREIAEEARKRIRDTGYGEDVRV